MREATDLGISAGIRRELSGRRIDLNKIKFPVKAGVVTLQGELCFVGIEKTQEETAVELKFIESSLRKIFGVKDITFELTEWTRNENGTWESSAAFSTASSPATSSLSFDGDGIVCPECDNVIRFCPCCGKPLSGAKTSGKSRRPVMPVRPVLKKKKPVLPISAPIISSPEAIKRMPITGAPPVISIPSARQVTPETNDSPAPTAPATPSQPQKQPAATVPQHISAPIKPAATIIQPPPKPAPPISIPSHPTSTVSPATNRPATPDIHPPKPATMPVTTHESSIPAIPVTPEIAEKKQSPEDPAIPDMPDFSAFASSPGSSDKTSEKKSENKNLFADIGDELPELADLPTLLSPSSQPTTPIKSKPPVPQSSNIPDFNFDELLSANEEPQEELPESTSPAVPDFNLGTFGDLNMSPETSDSDELNDTPLPPTKSAKTSPIDAFEDDDTPLPPMRPKTPPAKESKDPFAALFSESGINLGLPGDNQGQGKDPFGNLDLELDVLEIFPGNDSQPAPTQGKKPPAPAKPAPADDNPFNMDNIIDLDSPVEEKPSSKKKGVKDPFDLDDFDISKFKL